MTNESNQSRKRRSGFSDAMRWYDANAGQLANRYESLSAEKVHAWLLPFLPKTPAAILDIGAGTGRDAEWFASLGHSVVAVEPSANMRAQAQRFHATAPAQWIDDHLPSLERIYRLGKSFDFILLSAVWMHVASSDRARAFRKLIALLKPGGAIAIPAPSVEACLRERKPLLVCTTEPRRYQANGRA